MSDIIKVVVDAMGGDNAPEAPIKGAVDAVNENEKINVVLVGRTDDIKSELAKYTYDKERITIVHAEDIIGFDEILNTKFWTTEKIANDLITLPYPTIADEFNNGLKELVTPSSKILFIFLSFLKLVITKNKSAITIEIMTLHVPDTLLKVVPNSLK